MKNYKHFILENNYSIDDIISYEGDDYKITNDKLEVDDLYINFSNYSRGLMFPMQLPLII